MVRSILRNINLEYSRKSSANLSIHNTSLGNEGNEEVAIQPLESKTRIVPKNIQSKEMVNIKNTDKIANNDKAVQGKNNLNRPKIEAKKPLSKKLSEASYDNDMDVTLVNNYLENKHQKKYSQVLNNLEKIKLMVSILTN